MTYPEPIMFESQDKLYEQAHFFWRELSAIDPQLREFAKAMLEKRKSALLKNPERSWTPWLVVSRVHLRERLEQEYKEWQDAKGLGMNEDDELIDIANFCWFLWYANKLVREGARKD